MTDPRHTLDDKGGKLADQMVEYIRREFPDEEHARQVLLGAYEQLSVRTIALRNAARPFDELDEFAERRGKVPSELEGEVERQADDSHLN